MAKEKLCGSGLCVSGCEGEFYFAAHPKYSAQEMYLALKKADIYVRHWDGERIRDYLRITIGTEEEMRILFDFWQQYIK